MFMVLDKRSKGIRDLQSCLICEWKGSVGFLTSELVNGLHVETGLSVSVTFSCLNH